MLCHVLRMLLSLTVYETQNSNLCAEAYSHKPVLVVCTSSLHTLA